MGGRVDDGFTTSGCVAQGQSGSPVALPGHRPPSPFLEGEKGEGGVGGRGSPTHRRAVEFPQTGRHSGHGVDPEWGGGPYPNGVALPGEGVGIGVGTEGGRIVALVGLSDWCAGVHQRTAFAVVHFLVPIYLCGLEVLGATGGGDGGRAGRREGDV